MPLVSGRPSPFSRHFVCYGPANPPYPHARGTRPRVWGLPFLTALCPSEHYHQQRGHRHQTLPQWAGQLVGLSHRWLLGWEGVVVAESSSAVLELLKQVSETPGVSLVTRLRLEAALYDPAPPRLPGRQGRPRKQGARRPTLQQLLTAAPTPWTPLTVNKW